ncbi:MAG: hypothetical protein WC070_02645 [Candidatus Magasanikbacteria bacterium]
MLKNIYQNKKASSFLFVMVFGFIAFTTITLGISSYALFESKSAKQYHRRDVAFHIAEAGIDYYRWHLIGSPEDYYDGTGGQSGPYVHDYKDKDGNVVGKFSLEIDVPLEGTHVVAVRSTGWSINNPASTRTIEAYFGYESFSNSAFVENSSMTFSATSYVYGKVFSNSCIVFNGTSNSWVESARLSCSGTPGISGSGGPIQFWRFPVPARSFTAVNSSFTDLYNMAIKPEGIYLGESGRSGWRLVFNANGTFQKYVVRTYSSTYFSISQQTYQGVFNLPENGVIYSTDHVWVEGVINGRITVVANSNSDIIINGNITYNEKYGDDVLGLMAIRDVIIPYNTPNDMEIDAVLLSATGSIFRPYYAGSIKNSLSIFGSQISYDGGGVKYLSGGNVVSGFINTYYTYDGNLLYRPPVGIPVIPGYKLISWKEIN